MRSAAVAAHHGQSRRVPCGCSLNTALQCRRPGGQFEKYGNDLNVLKGNVRETCSVSQPPSVLTLQRALCEVPVYSCT